MYWLYGAGAHQLVRGAAAARRGLGQHRHRHRQRRVQLQLLVENQICADGAATVVFIDMEKQKPVRIPEALRNLISEGIQ
ncbi:MAG TPA: hypothetical protein VGO02_10550 [Burkholderiales bacterium]|nr:hypothetical protein [Burkholderiales bacterium]